MHDPTVIDHLLAFAILVVYPAAGYRSFRRLLTRAGAGMPIDRRRLYRGTMLGHWSLFAVAVAYWALTGRAWHSLGISFAPAPEFAGALLLCIVCIVLLVAQLRQVRVSALPVLEEIASRFGRVGIILPRNQAELRRFNGVALTAGIVEETLWRGFLFWYFGHWLPLWAAAVASTVAFALGHAYQGFANLPKIALVGALFAVLYVMSGSLALPVVMHAAVDLLQGRLAFEVLSRTGADRTVSESSNK